MSKIDDELISEFLIESYENLDRLDGELVSLEENPGSEETLGSIFRTIHTIKGTCGFLEFKRLETVTHAGENLLSSLRDGDVGMTEERASALLSLVDVVRNSLIHIEQNSEESCEQNAELISVLEQLVTDSVGEALAESPAPAVAEKPSSFPADCSPSEQEVLASFGVMDDSQDDSLATEDMDPPSALQEAEFMDQELIVEADEKAATNSIAAQNIRVQVGQLDGLMNLAGELVLARNQIVQLATSSQDPSTMATAQRLNLITTELQEGIMKIRMQPIGSLWSKFPRVVRDLSQKLGKKIRLVMEGQDTELDKTLLEAIKDPLTHLVRNSIDHGIQNPETRITAGKSEHGTLTLRAYHESGQVNIEICDDGVGLNTNALRAKAIASGILTPEEAKTMSDHRALSLIYHPGLSTAKEVTNVSGRGVGMDVVKTNIEAIGGTIEIASEQGKGTTIRIKIPLTLAIIPALIVTAAGERYAIPQVSLVELVRLDSDLAGNTQIEDLHGCPVYRLRGHLLPLVFLDEALGIREKNSQNTARNLVVVRADEHLFGLVVENINDTEEIVVKPLDRQTKSVGAYAGTTILGDGRVSLIIDVFGLALSANVITQDRHQRSSIDESSAQCAKDSETYLLIRVSGDRRMAIRLSAVDRLEEFQDADVESTNDGEVVQYRDNIMPLLRISKILGMPSSQDEHDSDAMQVVVHSRGEYRYGMAVDAITDIVEVIDPVSRKSNRPDLEATVIIDGKVTDVIDLDAIVSPYTQSEILVASEKLSNEEDQNSSSSAKQLCTFYLEELFFGVDVMQVQEVLRHQSMTKVPLSSPVVQGLINLRGQTVTALDMRTRLGIPPRYDNQEEVNEDDLPMNVVLRSSDGVVSILVDRIGDVVTVIENDRAEMPETVDPEIKRLVSDVYKLPGKLLLVLDIDQAVEVLQSVAA